MPLGMAASSTSVDEGATVTKAGTSWPTLEIPNLPSAILMVSFAATMVPIGEHQIIRTPIQLKIEN